MHATMRPCVAIGVAAMTAGTVMAIPITRLGRLIMRRPSTVESSSGAAAAIMAACARSGSVWGGTTSRMVLLPSSPRPSTVFGGWGRYPSS